MAKVSPIESIYNLPKYLKEDNLLPIYFLFGEDSFTINNAIKSIEKKISPLVESEFDKEVINLTKEQTPSQFIDLLYSFPFGGGKKFVVVKNFELVNDKKSFASYVKDPSDFTILVVAQYSKNSNLRSDPYKSLFEKKYIFEARELAGKELSEWMYKKAKLLNINLSKDVGDLLLEMVGENKGILEMQLQKIATYVSEHEEITTEVIKTLSQKTKEYSVFDLQNAIGYGQKNKAIEYAFNLLDSGTEIVAIIAMLTSFFSRLAQILEIKDDTEGRSIMGGRYFYLKKMKYILNEQKIANALNALLEADIRVKTTNIDKKTNISILIAQILK